MVSGCARHRTMEHDPHHHERTQNNGGTEAAKDRPAERSEIQFLPTRSPPSLSDKGARRFCRTHTVGSFEKIVAVGQARKQKAERTASRTVCRLLRHVGTCRQDFVRDNRVQLPQGNARVFSRFFVGSASFEVEVQRKNNFPDFRPSHTVTVTP